MVEGDHPQRGLGRLCEELGGPAHLFAADAARLVPPRAHRVQADDEQLLRAVDRLGRLPLALELAERSSKTGREGVGDVVVPWDHEQWWAEAAEEGGGAFVLPTSAAVGEVARDGDQLGRNPLDQRFQAALDLRFLDASRVQI